MDPTLAAVLGIAAAAVAVVGAAVAIWQAVVATLARNDARRDRAAAAASAEEVRALAAEANAAFVRQAEAQEERNRVRREERETARFQLARYRGDLFRLTNTGPKLYGVKVVKISGFIHIDEDSAREVLANGDSVVFGATALGGELPRAAVEFFLDEERERPGRNQFTVG